MSKNKTHGSVAQLVNSHPLISDQVDRQQVTVILEELEKALDRTNGGAVVELGCYVGTTSLFIRRLLDMRRESSSRNFHVYDSFEGLPEKTTYDLSPSGVDFKAGELSVSKKSFLKEFQKAHLTPPIIHKGWFSEFQPADVPELICFAFLDGDFYESIRDSLALVLPNMQPRGVIVIDDYAREALPGAAKATHEYFSPSNIRTVHNLGIIHLKDKAV